ncbi:MFS transporter [Flexivirga caeni]|uniref:MFS transporter n=1 Tax=Flexivirga caeni TaxID=2294115 RepID=A0A3M9MAH5_9MICO|nr:MFS transporter [Flexivirga caeni]RNI22225.1 MFS transporter [Flexivirga caeni]
MTDSPWTPLRRMALAGSVLLVGLVAFEQIAVSTAMPTVARQLHGLGIYPVAFAIPMAASVVGMVIAGTWADWAGSKVVILTGTALFVGGLVIAGGAASMPVLVLGRTVQSLGGGLNVVALYVLIAAAFPAQLRPKVFVGTSGAWVAPSLFGPPVAGYLATEGHWRWVFWLAAAAALPALALLLPVMRRLPPPEGSREEASVVRRRWIAAVGAAVGAAVLSVAADQPGVIVVIAAAIGVALLVWFAPRLVPRGTVRAARGMPAIVATRALLGSAFSGADVYLPLMLTRQHGMTATEAGLVLTVGATSWFVGAWFAGRMKTAEQQRRVVRIGLVLLSIGIAGAIASAWPATPGVLLYVAWLIGGSGIGLAYSPLTVLLMGMSAPEEQGRNSSALQTGETLTTSVLLAVSGIVFSALGTHSEVLAFVSGLVLALLTALLGTLVSRRLAPGTAGGTQRALVAITEASDAG